ncbi:MAG: hypothetical protein BIP78_1013 [Candidatus Bipolaricaulis sibiricus]|uniref:peptidylprolyl isomerase n=1 Tax=Bipolaricaulis sibiricus TaxID=2501609 RepID=A0A410FUK9_BIPS1|nr:MAG: hypothetical protein BIP78_1013 [Candidatus Bipolaricaulis sibiricus]
MIRYGVIACLAVGMAALASDPVAVVNGEPILREELDRATGLAEIVFMLSQQFPGFAQSLLLTDEGKAFVARYERDVLEKLILRRIQLQEATRRGLAVDEGEVAQRTRGTLAQIYAHYGLTEAEFEERLLAQGYTLERYREDIARDHRERLLLAALKASVVAEIAVSDEEIQAYYDEDPSRFVDEDGQPLALDDVRDRIETLIRRDKGEAVWQAWLVQARQGSTVEIKL